MKEQSTNDFTAYEYKEVTVESSNASLYLDGYESFGWQQDEKFPPKESGGKTTLKLKRNRKLANKVELTRLQRHFEANMQEIHALENSKSSVATIWALSIAVLGTVFMTGSVFAVTAKPPQVALCIILSIPAFAGWLAPYFVYQKVKHQKTQQVEPFITAKMEEIYALCEKGQSLL